MYYVSFYLKGQQKKTEEFKTRDEAIAFRRGLETNPTLESVRIQKA